MSGEKRIRLKSTGIQPRFDFQMERKGQIPEKDDLKGALEIFDSSLPLKRANEYSVESLVSLSSIRKIYENLEKKLEMQKRSLEPHSVVMKEEEVTLVEIILKETPLKQWYTTGKTLGSLASIGAKVALQLLKNKKDERVFNRLRLLEIEVIHRKLEENT